MVFGGNAWELETAPTGFSPGLSLTGANGQHKTFGWCYAVVSWAPFEGCRAQEVNEGLRSSIIWHIFLTLFDWTVWKIWKWDAAPPWPQHYTSASCRHRIRTTLLLIKQSCTSTTKRLAALAAHQDFHQTTSEGHPKWKPGNTHGELHWIAHRFHGPATPVASTRDTSRTCRSLTPWPKEAWHRGQGQVAWQHWEKALGGLRGTMRLVMLGESPFLSQIALCCLISVCHAEEVTQPLEWITTVHDLLFGMIFTAQRIGTQGFLTCKVCLHPDDGLLGHSSPTNASLEDRGVLCFVSKLQLKSLPRAGTRWCHHCKPEKHE